MLAPNSAAAFRNPAAPKLLLDNVHFYTHISAFFYFLNIWMQLPSHEPNVVIHLTKRDCPNSGTVAGKLVARQYRMGMKAGGSK